MVDANGRVLLIDDDELMLRVCARVLEQVGLTADLVQDARHALERIRKHRYDAIVSDIQMPGIDGIGLLRAAREYDATVPFVLMTGAPSLESAVSAIDFGALKYLQKPFDIDDFASVVQEAVSQRVQAATVADLNRRLDLALDKLWMAYQPIVRWSGRSVFSFEALFRTSAAEVSGPLEMLDLAERTRRLFDVGRGIRARVARDLPELDESTQVFVNLHPADFEDPELYQLDAPLSAFAPRVVLEITERASISHLANIDEKIRTLRALGFRVAIDDIGAGYAGLTTFAQVQPEFVKLDGSLVRSIEKDRARQVVVSSIMALAKDLQTHVIAECIETQSERQYLASVGVDLMQGFYFARPGRPFVAPRPEAMLEAL